MSKAVKTIENVVTGALINRRVLVVEDDEGLNNLAQKSLRRVGFDMQGVLTGTAAIKRVMADPDLTLLVDQQLPDMAGTELIRTLIEQDCRVPFVAMTGHGDENIAVEMMKLGARDYLIKGFDFTDRLPEVFQRVFRELETERRLARAEHKLRESENRFRDIIHSLADWIWEVDKNGKFTYIAGTGSDILGYSVEELIEKTSFELIVPEERAKIVDVFFKCSSKLKPVVDLEHWNLAKDGTKVCLLTNGVPIIDTNGELLGYRGVNKDITNQKKLAAEKTAIEAKLQQSQKMEAIGTLAGGIAHDFNNILSGIFGYTELLQMRMPKDSELLVYLDSILKAGNRAKDLVQQILTYTRQSENDLNPMRIQTVIKEALKLIESSLPSTIAIRQKIQNDCGLIMANHTQIHQIIMNLCTNASCAMEKTGGELTVCLREVELAAEDFKKHTIKPGNYVQLTVTDNGTGMDQGVIERIFEPYFTTKEVGAGTGMGLATVHGIVENHGGDIKVSSRPGIGTTLNLLFPRIEGKAGKAIEASDSLLKGKEHILFVDDEKPIVDVGKKSLERLGYHVETKTSSYDALETFRKQPDKYDLIITDMTMPKMTGEKLSEKIKEIKPDIPIILCSGFNKNITPEKSMEMGISSILVKPLTMHDLAKTIRKVLDEAKMSVRAS